MSRKFTVGISVFVQMDLYQTIRKSAHEKDVSVSEFVRQAIIRRLEEIENSKTWLRED